jgi:hypothetical protein
MRLPHADGQREDQEDEKDPQEETEHLEVVSPVRPPFVRDPRAAGQIATMLARLDGRHDQLLPAVVMPGRPPP